MAKATPLAHGLRLIALCLEQLEKEPKDYRDAYFAVRGGLRQTRAHFETGQPLSTRELVSLAAYVVVLLRARLELEGRNEPVPNVDSQAIYSELFGTARQQSDRQQPARQPGCTCIYADGRRLAGEHPCKRHPGGT